MNDLLKIKLDDKSVPIRVAEPDNFCARCNAKIRSYGKGDLDYRYLADPEHPQHCIYCAKVLWSDKP